MLKFFLVFHRHFDLAQDESFDANVGEFNWDLKYIGSQILLTQVIRFLTNLVRLSIFAIGIGEDSGGGGSGRLRWWWWRRPWRSWEKGINRGEGGGERKMEGFNLQEKGK